MPNYRNLIFTEYFSGKYDRNYIKHDYVIINHIKENAAFRKEFNNEILPDYLSFLGEPNPTPVDAWFYDVIENYF